ncbi:MAG: M23 family metallopeptidase [Mucinivorans sp.]
MRHLLLVILLTITIIPASQAKKRRSYGPPKQLSIEQVKSVPIDTVATEDDKTKIVIFSNNTWKFIHPDMDKLDDLPVYRHNWDTTSIFAYRNVELKDLPSIIELKLADGLEDYSVPLRGNVISKYGPRGRRNHKGVDVPLRMGEPVLAAFDGKVRYAKFNSGGFGYLVILRHKNGLETYSAHLSRINVKVDDYVKAGQVIGFGGQTGRARGPHLHFEMRYCDQVFDPEFIFDFVGGTIRYTNFALEKKFFNIHSRASEMLEDIEDDLTGEDILAAADDSVGMRVIENKPPVKKPATSDAVYHYVKSGDMLGKLALKYGVSVDQICRLSGITRNSMLHLKQKLRIK